MNRGRMAWHLLRSSNASARVLDHEDFGWEIGPLFEIDFLAIVMRSMGEARAEMGCRRRCRGVGQRGLATFLVSRPTNPSLSLEASTGAKYCCK